jgi:hypothetical protein
MPLRFQRPLAPQALRRCAVCHGTDVVEDEVFDEGVLLLGECRRCEHRWTSRPGPLARSTRHAPRRAVQPGAGREGVASAA